MVAIAIDLTTVDELARENLIKAERQRGRELRAMGAIRAIWRVPGDGLRNVGVWRAADEIDLRALIESLPMHAHMRLEITPLLHHPHSDIG